MAERSHLPVLRAKALRWLAQREHSRQELRDKLVRWQRGRPAAAPEGADAPDAGSDACDTGTRARQLEALLDELTARGLLSDARFAEARVHARSARFGNRRIEGELHLRGVVPAPELVQQLKATELARARELLRVRFGRAPGAVPDATERLRRQRFLASRGFSAETIQAVLRDQDHEG